MTYEEFSEKYRSYKSETMKKVVRDTLWHEIGHHFGFTEEELAKIKNQKN